MLSYVLNDLSTDVHPPCLLSAGKDLREAGVSWRDVFVEIPIKIHNSSLTQALIADLNPSVDATAGDLERLNLGTAAYLSKTMDNLIECMDDLLAEQQKVSLVHTAIAAEVAACIALHAAG